MAPRAPRHSLVGAAEGPRMLMAIRTIWRMRDATARGVCDCVRLSTPLSRVCHGLSSRRYLGGGAQRGGPEKRMAFLANE